MEKSFLENFEALCRSRGLSPSGALKKAGLSNSLYTKWKKFPDTVPNLDTLKKLSSVLYVTVDELAYGRPDDERLINLINYPALRELLQARNRMSQAQMDEILRYAKYLCPDAFEVDK